MAGTFVFLGKTHNVYKDTHFNLEFIFVENQEVVFWSLLEEHGDANNIPADVLLTGIYFHEGTRDISPNYENSSIEARYISK